MAFLSICLSDVPGIRVLALPKPSSPKAAGVLTTKATSMRRPVPGMPEAEGRHRAVDYIAGMIDRFAMSEHERPTGPRTVARSA